MPKPWLTVLHNPARPEYLQRTLLELDSAGAAQLAAAGELLRYIAVDGDPDVVNAPPGWEKGAVGNGRQGTRRAFLRVLQAAAAGGATHLLHFEDDVLACKHAVTCLHSIPVHPDCGFLTACNTRQDEQIGRTLPVSYVLSDTPRFWGTQAIKIPGATLVYLASLTIAEDDPNLNSCDVWLGEHAASPSAPWPSFAWLSPSLFQHVGARSLAWPTEDLRPVWRTARDFDPWFDARRFLKGGPT
jgi:hypothetical protein